MGLRKEGKRDAAEFIKHATETTPKRASKIKKAYVSSQEPRLTPLSQDEALAVSGTEKERKK